MEILRSDDGGVRRGGVLHDGARIPERSEDEPEFVGCREGGAEILKVTDFDASDLLDGGTKAGLFDKGAGGDDRAGLRDVAGVLNTIGPGGDVEYGGHAFEGEHAEEKSEMGSGIGHEDCDALVFFSELAYDAAQGEAGFQELAVSHGPLDVLDDETAAAVVAQAFCALPFFPYYYNYFNPIMEAGEAGRQNPNFGYGEGLELAARYLEEKPDATDTTVMAFYGRGPFSYFYSGTTEPLKTVYADAENVPQLVQLLHRTDYLVVYYAIQHGRQAPANVMRALEGINPEKTIWLNGIEYVRIYDMGAMPPEPQQRLCSRVCAISSKSWPMSLTSWRTASWICGD